MARASTSTTKTLAGCCLATFWSGAVAFGYTGVMGASWQERFGAGSGETGLVVTVMLLGISAGTLVSGGFRARFGMRACIACGTALMLAAMGVLAAATGIGWVYAWAFLVSLGASFVYGPGLTTVQEALPARRGLASGLLNVTFGLSAAIMSPIWEYVLTAAGHAAVDASLTVCFLVTNALAFALVGPRGVSSGAVREGDCRSEGPSKTEGAPADAACPSRLGRESGPEAEAGPGPEAGLGAEPVASLTPWQALRTRDFWLLWFAWAFVGAAGISMVSLAKSYSLYLGLAGAAMLSAFNVTNGAGRLVAGLLCDAIGGELAALSAFAVAAVGYALLIVVDDAVGVVVLAACVGYGFGALFATTGPIATKRFGMEHFGSIFGCIFLAYGCVGGVIGPALAGALVERLANPYPVVFGYLALFALVGVVLMALLRRTSRIRNS